ncbi:hypothetical protein NIES4071_30200 [Calothrix sp. NIES-4071]|nr:hypothetical protein NIES4071_30200 [Calothrix sp. NIES-4071]BAZ57340.1 hypothetical protein NIES4105_30140 [Calothrix sp. NIES-4105]
MVYVAIKVWKVPNIADATPISIITALTSSSGLGISLNITYASKLAPIGSNNSTSVRITGDNERVAQLKLVCP